jgi:hypothetical protein
MIEAWQIIRDAGPLALAAAFFMVWWLERSRANDERQKNEALVERLHTGLKEAAEAVRDLRELFFRSGEKDRDR